MTAVRFLGVSGPDGAGKTTLVDAVAASLREQGAAVVSIHPYGCIICRHWPDDLVPQGLRHHASPSPMRHALRYVHALVDTCEFALRVGVAEARVAVGGRVCRRMSVVVTDRTPLDALVKHGGAAGWLTTAWLVQLARRYERILVLDADAALLRSRGRDEDVDTLARWGSRLVPEASRLQDVEVLHTKSLHDSEIVPALLGGLADGAAGAAPGTAASRDH